MIKQKMHKSMLARNLRSFPRNGIEAHMIGVNDNTPEGQDPLSRERRFGARCRAFKQTQVILPDQDSVFDAIMRNLSRTGARLELPDVLHIPKEFKMRLVNDNITRDCKVVWRKPGAMGVVFLG